MLLPVPGAATRGWPLGAAAAADAVLGAPAARQVRDPAQRQRDRLRHRARPDRSPRRLPLPPQPPGRCEAAALRRDGPGAGRPGAARVPPDRRRADPRRALGGVGDGPALAPGPVRRCRARPEEGRSHVRGLRDPARARRRHGRGQRPEGCRRRRPDRAPARHHAAAAARRGHQVLRPGRRRRQLRGVPVSDAAGLLFRHGRALHQRHGRSPAGELFEPARGQARVPPADRAAPARHARLSALPAGLAALAPGCRAGRCAGPAGLCLGPGALSRGQVDPAEVGLGRSAQGPQGRDRGDRRRAQVSLRRDRERGLRRRGSRSSDRRRSCARAGARSQVRAEGARAGPSCRQ